MPPKRACDNCISRKVRCSGSSPCETCSDAAKPVSCTYLRPARKRGPKGRRLARQGQFADAKAHSPDFEGDHAGSPHDSPRSHDGLSTKSNSLPERISRSVLALIVRHYQQSSYSVWPVINAERFLEEINDIELENSDPQAAVFDCLVTSLCAATMAQLHLAPIWDGASLVDSTVMGQTCLHIRDNYNCDRGNLGISSILTSFFLHVYHAKLNQRTSAMLYIQEAIAGARMLRLDKLSSRLTSMPGDSFVMNRELIFPLLWVTERGYALHLNVSPLYTETLSVPEFAVGLDTQARGLLDLVRLFVAFDHISVRRQPHASIASAPYLTDTEIKLSSVRLNTDDHISARTADCHITREWMRTILWQKALALGFLSSTSYTAMMNFGFPGQIGRDLLRSLRYFTAADLLPLGRDQLLKCFEIASTLADTILLTSAAFTPGCEFGPHDFLHALYQKLLPSLEQDLVLKSNLRSKMAEVLVTAPARLLIMEPTSMEKGGVVEADASEDARYYRGATGLDLTI